MSKAIARQSVVKNCQIGERGFSYQPAHFESILNLVITFLGLAKVAIFSTNVDAENQTLINYKYVCGALSRHFCQTRVNLMGFFSVEGLSCQVCTVPVRWLASSFYFLVLALCGWKK